MSIFRKFTEGRRTRRALLVAAVAAAGALGTAGAAQAYTIPHNSVTYADHFVIAFGAKNTSRLQLLGSSSAASTAVAAYYLAGPTWARQSCDGAMGSLYCRYTNGHGRSMIVRVNNFAASMGQAHSVSEVQFPLVPAPSDPQLYSDMFMRAWKWKDTQTVYRFASTNAATSAFSHYAKANAYWYRVGSCDGAAGSTYCTYRNSITGKKVLVRIYNEEASLRHLHAVAQMIFL